jgi:hypothetical protein
MVMVPLYDLLTSHSALPPMEEHLRDRGCPAGYVEARRKTDLRKALTDFKGGQSHPLLFILAVLDSTLISSRHALNDLRKLAHDQNSFDHYFHKIKKETPEKFQDARQQHINRLAEETLQPRHRSIPYIPSEQDVAWADRLLISLDDPATKAIDVVEEIAIHIVPKSAAYRWGELKMNIGKMKKGILCSIPTIHTSKAIYCKSWQSTKRWIGQKIIHATRIRRKILLKFAAPRKSLMLWRNGKLAIIHYW